jgi:low temperature requirement protein LtrA
MREPATAGRVTNIELFFDLVYVFAVTQLSHYLLARQSLTGALRTALLLIMVWLLWVYIMTAAPRRQRASSPPRTTQGAWAARPTSSSTPS